MKKLVAILFFIQISSPAFSQKHSGIWLGFHGGLTSHTWNPEPFNNFVASYNNYLAANLKDSLTVFGGVNSAFARGFGGWVEHNDLVFGMDYYKSQFSPTIQSAFKNGRGHLIELEFTDWMVNIELGKRVGGIWVFNGILGTNLRSGVVRVNTIHFDGSYSQSGEFYFSGVYRGGLQSDITLGMKLKVDVTPYTSLTFSGIRTLPLFETDLSRTLSAFKDARPGKDPATSVFPADLKKYEENAQSGIYDYEKNIIPMSFRGWYLNASLSINLKILDL